MDLLDHYRGRLSARRISVLLKHLPAESALVRAVRGDDAEWGLTEHLLAGVIDQLAVGNWMFASVNTPEGGDRPERPEPIPRPGVSAPDDRASATPDEIASFFTP